MGAVIHGIIVAVVFTVVHGHFTSSIISDNLFLNSWCGSIGVHVGALVLVV